MARKTNCVIGGKKRYRLRKKVNGEMMNFYGDYYEDAIRVYKEHLNSLEANAEFKRSEVFQDVFESWFEIVHKPKLAPSSYTTYESTYRVHIKPMKFTRMNLVDVRSIDIQQGINKIDSAYRANRIYLLLSTFYKYCLSQPDRVIYHNPLDTVNVPKHHKNTVKKLYLMKADVARLLHFFESDFSLFIYVFAAFTGMRQGEILALRVKDLNLNTMLIDIHRSVKYVKIDEVYLSHFRPPKTEKGIRLIPILPQLVDSIKKQIADEKKKHLRLGVKYSDDALLFSNKTLGPQRAAHLLVSWKRKQTHYDMFDELVDFHTLRHTFASILCAQGVSIRTTADLMGHSSTDEVEMIYAHVEPAVMAKAIDKLSEYYKTSDL